MIKPTDRVNIFTTTERYTKVNGSMISNKAMELKFGLMGHDMKACSWMEKRKAKAF